MSALTPLKLLFYGYAEEKETVGCSHTLFLCQRTQTESLKARLCPFVFVFRLVCVYQLHADLL